MTKKRLSLILSIAAFAIGLVFLLVQGVSLWIAAAAAVAAFVLRGILSDPVTDEIREKRIYLKEIMAFLVLCVIIYIVPCENSLYIKMFTALIYASGIRLFTVFWLMDKADKTA